MTFDEYGWEALHNFEIWHSGPDGMVKPCAPTVASGTPLKATPAPAEAHKHKEEELGQA